jgi:hypothetical protein
MFDGIILATTSLTTIIEWAGGLAFVLAVGARRRMVRSTGRVAMAAFRTNAQRPSVATATVDGTVVVPAFLTAAVAWGPAGLMPAAAFAIPALVLVGAALLARR